MLQTPDSVILYQAGVIKAYDLLKTLLGSYTALTSRSRSRLLPKISRGLAAIATGILSVSAS